MMCILHYNIQQNNNCVGHHDYFLKNLISGGKTLEKENQNKTILTIKNKLISLMYFV